MKTIRAILLGLVFLIATGFNLQNSGNDNGGDFESSVYQYSQDLNLAVALYTMWDMDHNRILDESEWDKSMELYGGSELPGAMSFADLDKNKNNAIDINEFREGLPVLDNQQLETIFKADPAKLVNTNRLEIWNTDSDEMVEKLVVGDLEVELDQDHN